MLKTPITGAKYLSPQTNQMTNLNIAIPAGSKDTEFGTSDMLLAKDTAKLMDEKIESLTDKALWKRGKKGANSIMTVFCEQDGQGGAYEAYAIAEGLKCSAMGASSHAEGYSTYAVGAYSHAEGNSTQASGPNSHAEGTKSSAKNEGSHAEGNSIARGLFSHSENKGTASGAFSHAEGDSFASGDYSHAEGSGCRTEDDSENRLVGSYCHVEGIGTICTSKGGHTEGNGTIVAGDFAHAEGVSSRSDGTAAHAEGKNTIASGDSAHAQGRFNVGNKYYIHSVGIGDQNQRKNAEYIYVNTDNTADPKNGYMYVYGIGGYDGIDTDNTKYKSLQETIMSIGGGGSSVWTNGSGSYSIVAINDTNPTASGRYSYAEGS
nr:MAG TPA_asm: hypothetical protein [Bacteriophage sp.]